MKAEPPQRAGVVQAGTLRVVIDTNIWISAALSRDGAPARLVRQVLEHSLPVFSPATFAELETRLWRPKFDCYLSMELRRQILHDLNAAEHWVEVPPEIAACTHCRDADDDKFIHAALAAGAAWLVSGDQDLLDAPTVPGVRILSAADALRLPEFSAQ
jgi:putative PIN family toxin of toxin-antitoxin system